MKHLFARTVDAVLEALVIPGFTAPGFAIRRRLFGWTDLEDLRMDGRVVLLTGGTSGIGLEAATQLASMGARVRSISRSAERAETAAEEIRATSGNDDVIIEQCDLSRPEQVEAYAERFRSEHDRLDALVHVAGAYFDEYTETPDGIEANAAIYVIGPFVLTEALAPLIKASTGPRIVTVSTGGAYTQKLDVDRLEADPDGYRPLAAYARVKRAEIALTHQWAQRFPHAAVHAMQPGWTKTGLVAEGLPRFRAVLGPILRSTRQAADTLVYLVVHDEPTHSTGQLWRDRRRRWEHRVPWIRHTDEDERRLWEWLVERRKVATAARR